MGRPYAIEMAELVGTFDSALSSDNDQIRAAVRSAAARPLLAVGSGGSLTAAHVLAWYHHRFSGCLATVATPLEVISGALDQKTAIWLLSAGGRNRDINSAFSILARREPQQLAVLCGSRNSPLARSAELHSLAEMIVCGSRTGKDGFLATNSLLTFIILIARAYMEEFCPSDQSFVRACQSIRPLLDPMGAGAANVQSLAEPLWTKDTILVLHGISTRTGAIDIESKFTEAGICNVQIADYRNFAHGRHHWLAKHGHRTAVLALIAKTDCGLAERTLALVPSDVPQAQIRIDGSPEAAALSSVIVGFHLAGWAGQARGIDPGRPGVPEYGRKLYNLAMPKLRPDTRQSRISDRDAVAIQRKSGLDASRVHLLDELEQWRKALCRFRSSLLSNRFVGLVLDYDGTVVNTRDRFSPPRPDMTDELRRLISAGVPVAIATGRGPSVRRDLQISLPKTLQPRILIGYYSGGEIGLLSDDSKPDNSEEVCPALTDFADALSRDAELSRIAVQKNRRFQITFTAKHILAEERVWRIVQELVAVRAMRDLVITRSGHSTDVLAPGTSKLNLIENMRKAVGDGPILCIGDCGCWPGNDFELLSQSFTLSVDQTSCDPDSCWNLAPRGQRGVDATLHYLRNLSTDKEHRLSFAAGALG